MPRNSNLTKAKKAANDELTPSQRAKRKYELKHRIPDSEFLKELRVPFVESEWFPIKNYPNYFINKNGVVYFAGSVSGNYRRKSRFITATLTKIGYYKVSLNKTNVFLHKIVAETFVDNPNNYTEIDHIDGNPRNNTISNLRWVTHKENLNNPVTRKKQSSSHTGLTSNIKGRKKIWIDRENKKYKMIKDE